MVRTVWWPAKNLCIIISQESWVKHLVPFYLNFSMRVWFTTRNVGLIPRPIPSFSMLYTATKAGRAWGQGYWNMINSIHHFWLLYFSKGVCTHSSTGISFYPIIIYYSFCQTWPFTLEQWANSLKTESYQTSNLAPNVEVRNAGPLLCIRYAIVLLHTLRDVMFCFEQHWQCPPLNYHQVGSFRSSLSPRGELHKTCTQT